MNQNYQISPRKLIHFDQYRAVFLHHRIPLSHKKPAELKTRFYERNARLKFYVQIIMGNLFIGLPLSVFYRHGTFLHPGSYTLSGLGLFLALVMFFFAFVNHIKLKNKNNRIGQYLFEQKVLKKERKKIFYTVEFDFGTAIVKLIGPNTDRESASNLKGPIICQVPLSQFKLINHPHKALPDADHSQEYDALKLNIELNGIAPELDFVPAFDMLEDLPNMVGYSKSINNELVQNRLEKLQQLFKQEMVS